jgi:hypothetical protein
MFARISGNKMWNDLAGKLVQNKSVYINNMKPDQYTNDKIPRFTSHNILFDNCDKHFMYYWLDPLIFNNASNIFILSKLSSDNCLWKFPYSKIYVSDEYKDIQQKNIIFMSENDINEEFCKQFFLCERLRFHDN